LSLQSFGYFLFLFVTVTVYLVLPKRLQCIFLLAASWTFYLIAIPTMFPVLLILTLFTYGCGRGMMGRYRRFFVRLGVFGSVAVLCVFKYFNFFRQLFPWGAKLPVLAWPLGLSYFLFEAISYLIDVYREKVPVERNLIRYALFISLFLTVSQGPICRAGQLLPQFTQEHRFDAGRIGRSLRLFAFGLFKAVAVADVVGILVDQVFTDYTAFGGWMLIVGCVGYSLQLYFSFSGYSEMARAGGMMLGLELPENFKTPYYSTSYSEIWARWHISLSGWLRDYVYISLGGNRKGKIRKQLNLFLTFIISGLWHGNTLPFLFWGLLQAVYRMGEELLHRIFGAPKPDIPAAVAKFKQLAVFTLWTGAFVFFRIGAGPNHQPLTLGDGFCYLWRCSRNLSLARFGQELWATVYSGFYANSIMVVFYLAFLAAALGFIWHLEHRRYYTYGNAPAEQVLAAQRPVWLYDLLLVIFILVGLIMQNGGFDSTNFGLYAGF